MWRSNPENANNFGGATLKLELVKVWNLTKDIILPWHAHTSNPIFSETTKNTTSKIHTLIIVYINYNQAKFQANPWCWSDIGMIHILHIFGLSETEHSAVSDQVIPSRDSFNPDGTGMFWNACNSCWWAVYMIIFSVMWCPWTCLKYACVNLPWFPKQKMQI